jgi:hypothetical protein
LILKLQNKSCYNCGWHKEYLPYIKDGEGRLLKEVGGRLFKKPLPKTFNQAVQEAIEEKKKSIVYKCCLDYGQRSDFPKTEICLNHKNG